MNAIQTFYEELTGLLPQEALIAITIVSVVMFFGTILLIPVIIIRLPVDYFLHDEEHVWMAEYHPVLRYIGLVIKNTVGLIFLLAGIAMLVLPGQGLLTMVIGVSLLDFPRQTNNRASTAHETHGIPGHERHSTKVRQAPVLAVGMTGGLTAVPMRQKGRRSRHPAHEPPARFSEEP